MPATVEVPVIVSKSSARAEAVSKRIVRNLQLPESTETLRALRFSPDGRRLSGGDFESGRFAIWDVASGKVQQQLTVPRNALRSFEFFHLSPDWRTLYNPKLGNRDTERIEEAGKKLIRWQFDGEVQAWDVETGRMSRVYRHQPARGIMQMEITPDALRLVTFEQLPGTYESSPQMSATLWDVVTGNSQELGQSARLFGRLSPSGRILGVVASDTGDNARSIKLFDVTTGRESRSIPISDKHSFISLVAFAPDERTLVGSSHVLEAERKWDTAKVWMIWWDSETGQELARFPGTANSAFHNSVFTSDGQRIAAVVPNGDQHQLAIYSLPEKRLIKNVLLGSKPANGSLIVRAPVISPNGRWLAIVTQVLPTTKSPDFDVRDAEQPRLHLIDVAAGQIIETMIAPPSWAYSYCFSHDSRMLATGGQGQVHLWDLPR